MSNILDNKKDSPGSNITMDYYGMYKALKELCQNNQVYFRKDNSDYGQSIVNILEEIICKVDNLIPIVEELRNVASSYDYNEETSGNGYKSFIFIIDSGVAHTVKICSQICTNRESLLFRKGSFLKEIEACKDLLESLTSCTVYLKTMISWSEPGVLFSKVDYSPDELLAKAEVNQHSFYGRCLGFQYVEPMRGILKGISISMACFSELYYSDGNLLSRATSSIWSGGKYLLDPELRAKRIVNINQYATVDFCKSFWFLTETEVAHRIPAVLSSNVLVNRVISVPPIPLSVANLKGEIIDVPIPSSHGKPRPIQLRLISAQRREGMIGEGSAKYSSPSRDLIIHCHGGGFVAQSSKSHQLYLREWAAQLNVPILSIDYSLAPEAPFPRALEEIYYAYCWAMENCQILGTTAERIVLAGDSAGGNLNLGLTLRCIETGIRKPSGLFLAYVPIFVSSAPSPSRMLCLMDPLLPFGFIMKCLKAYACPNSNLPNSPVASTNESFEMFLSNDLNDFAHNDNEANDLHNVISTSDSANSSKQSYTSQNEIKTDLTANSVICNGNSDLRNRSSSEPYISQTVHENGCKTDWNEQIDSDKYVNEFLDKYVLDINSGSEPCLRRSAFTSDEIKLFDFPQGVPRIPEKISKAAKDIFGSFSGMFTSMTSSNAVTGSQVLSNFESISKSPGDDYKFQVPRNPLLSPYWAEDHILRQLPPVKVLTMELDPFLDDCVMFTRKLKHLGHDVGLDIISGLPHGFLNLAMMSKEAHKGSVLCAKRIKELLDK